MSADVYQMPTSAGEYTQAIPVKAGEIINAGSLFGVDSSGRAVPGDDASALRIAGRATAEADNTAAGAADGDVTVYGERLTYTVSNSAVTPLVAADILKPCFLEDLNVVCKTRVADEPLAGIFLGFDGDLVVVQIIATPLATAPTLTSTNGTAAAAADLAALKTESEKIGDDVRALHAALLAAGIIG